MAKIKKIIAREIIDSRAYPTIEAIILLEDNSVGTFSTPSGTSIGKYEAKEIRDGDIKRFKGMGVLSNLKNIFNIIAPKLIGQEANSQEQIDQILIDADGTADKSVLGANTLLAISGAVAKTAAASLKIPLYQYIARLSGQDTRHFAIPTPMFNVLNGGKHANANLDFQEFMVVPPQSSHYSANLRMAAETYYTLKTVIREHNAIPLIGDEGGYAPTFYSNLDALKVLEETVSKAGYNLGVDVFFALDIAASFLKLGSSYKIKDKPISLTASDFLDYLIVLNEQYHFLSIEDPFGEDEWNSWISLTAKLGGETLIVGDDLTATNLERLNKAISQKAANSIVIKPNQVGTITETLKVVKAAKNAQFKIIVSHRSGETNDDFIADFAVGIDADYVKFGAPARGERVAKYNRLLEIEHELS